MDTEMIRARLAGCQKLLIGLGEEWKWKRGDEAQEAQLRAAYANLYELVKDKDYFIITMATDALIFETELGSQTETAVTEEIHMEEVSCPAADEQTQAMMDRLFPVKEKPKDKRVQRIVAPCGNETWKQCSAGCTKDIWEPDEIPSGICPHCGAPLTGNTIEAHPYIEEGYLPQWNHYTQWLAGTFRKDLVILELGVGFANPGVLRFPFEKTAFFHQDSLLLRVNQTFPQTTEELKDRALGVHKNSVDWMIKSDYNVE